MQVSAGSATFSSKGAARCTPKASGNPLARNIPGLLVLTAAPDFERQPLSLRPRPVTTSHGEGHSVPGEPSGSSRLRGAPPEVCGRRRDRGHVSAGLYVVTPVSSKPLADKASSAGKARHHTDRSRLIQILRVAGVLLPGDWAKTAFYRTLIAGPRRALRRALNGFYRIDQIYSVLEEARGYGGELSILEFGTHQGYAFTKMLYATRYLGLEDRVTVHTFDSFEGLPPPADRRDRNVVAGDEVFAAGQFHGNYRELDEYCRKRYRNYAIHQGYFADVLSPELLDVFSRQLPILLWVDCDYYSSARTVMERMLPFIPSGCVVYFDDYRYNFGSRLTGEARMVHEINRGDYGDNIELVIDSELGLDSRSVYRFIRLEGGPRYRLLAPPRLQPGRRRTNDSALP
jgi:hypothetical protein